MSMKMNVWEKEVEIIVISMQYVLTHQAHLCVPVMLDTQEME